MVLKIASLFMLSITSHMVQLSSTRAEWIYDSGPNKGYVCGLIQTDGTKFDVYLPAIWPAPTQAAPSAVPWLRFGSQNQAMDAVNAYCPGTVVTTAAKKN